MMDSQALIAYNYLTQYLIYEIINPKFAMNKKMTLRIKQFYLEEWKLFKTKFLKLFIIIFIIFILTILISHFIFIKNPERLQKISALAAEGILKEQPVLERNIQLFLSVFFNNAIVALVTIIFGFIPFLFLSMLGALRIGVVIWLMTSVASINGFKAWQVLLFSFAPHGIFEFSAMVYATSIGVHLCLQISKRILNLDRDELIVLFSKKNQDYRSEDQISLFKRALKTWLGVIVPLLIVAAIIETFITPFSFLYKIFLGQ